MKLAEALLERAELKIKIERLRTRLLSNAEVQEGTETAEDPVSLLKELNSTLQRMEYLITHINQTNNVTKVSSGETIAELIAKKDVLTKRIAILSDFYNRASTGAQRARHTEIKILPTMDIKPIQKEIDKLSKELRILDVKLQESNWLAELI